MKNIEASVGVIHTQEQKARDEGEIEGEEEEYIWKANETLFYLKGNPDCYLVVGGEWHGNKAGEVIGDVDLYFRHILNRQRCESVWDAVDGYACFDDRWADAWEKLAMHIEDIPNLEKIVCRERGEMMIPR